MKAFWKKHGKKIVILVIIAGVITAAVFFVRKQVKASQELLSGMMNQSEIALVEKRTLVDSLAATGTVTAIDSKSVTANVTNVKIKEFTLEVGDYVKEGDVICVLDTESLEDNIRIARTNYDASKGQSNVNEVAAGRALDFAEESKSIDMGRAGEDVSWAYQDYLRQLTEVERAEEDYKEAQKEYEDKKAELQYRRELLDEAKEDEDAFKEAEYEQEVSLWETKVTSAESARDAAKKTYENSITTADSYYRTYIRQTRTETDTERNDDNTILTRNDSLYTSQISNNATGVSEQVQIKNYQEQIADCTVYAPISGIVTATGVEEGKYYTGSTIVTIEDDSVYEISAQIDEYDITRVKVGQKVIFKTNGTGDDEFNGTVKEIAPKATRSVSASGVSTLGSNVTYEVTISIDTPDERLKMDMTAKLSIIIEEKNDVLTVPYDALQIDDDGAYFIEVPGSGDQMTEITYATDTPDQSGQEAEKPENERIYVTKGLESDYYVQVLGPEIKEGMEVIVPSTGDGMNEFMQMLQEQGAMGGF